MVLDFFPTNLKRPLLPVLTIRAKLYDGAEITATLADKRMRFRTSVGTVTITLSEIVRMKNISNVVALRRELWASKFEIVCDDDSLLIGTPLSPHRLYFSGNIHALDRGHIELWEIDSLVTLLDHHA